MTLDELAKEPKREPKLLTEGTVKQAKRGSGRGNYRGGHLILIESEDCPGRVEYKYLTQDGSLIDPWDGSPDGFLGAVGGE